MTAGVGVANPTRGLHGSRASFAALQDITKNIGNTVADELLTNQNIAFHIFREVAIFVQ